MPHAGATCGPRGARGTIARHVRRRPPPPPRPGRRGPRPLLALEAPRPGPAGRAARGGDRGRVAAAAGAEASPGRAAPHPGAAAPRRGHEPPDARLRRGAPLALGGAGPPGSTASPSTCAATADRGGAARRDPVDARHLPRPGRPGRARRRAEATGEPQVLWVGHSQGALLGLVAAQKYRERIAGVVALAPPIRLPLEPVRTASSPSWRAGGSSGRWPSWWRRWPAGGSRGGPGSASGSTTWSGPSTGGCS